MPTINKRFLIVLLLVLAVLTGVVAGVHTVQAERIPGALLRQADRAVTDEKPDAAIRYLRQYLEFRPDDIDARERLAGLLKTRNGDTADLLMLYDKILRADPNRVAVRRDALAVCLRIGRLTDAETHAEVLLSTLPDDADVWQKLAMARAGLQKTSEARVGYETAVKLSPTDPAAAQRAAAFLLREMKAPDEARAVLDRLVIAAPESAEAYLSRAKFLITAAEASPGVASNYDPFPDLTAARKLDPTHAEVLLLLAEQHQKKRQLATAHDLLATGIQHHPDDVKLIRAMAWLEVNRGNPLSAVSVLEDGLVRVKDGTELLVPLADMLVQLGETARTMALVAKLEARPSPVSAKQVKYLTARLAMRANDWRTAGALFTDLRTESVHLPALEAQANLLLSICFSRQGEVTQEQETLRLILNKDPNHISARVGLARSLLNVGRTADAIREYEMAVRTPGAGPEVHAALLKLKAREMAVGGGRPQDWAQLDRVASELATVAGPNATEPVLLRAMVAESRGDRPRAAALLRAEAARRPGDPRLWSAAALAIADLGGVAAGLGVLDEAQAAVGDGPDIRLVRADLYARDPARLYPLEPLLIRTDGWADADRDRLAFGMVEIFDRLGDDKAAIAAYRPLAARRPDDPLVWDALGERAIRSGDATVAAEARANALRLDSTGKAAALFDAWAAFAGKNSESARAALDRIAKAYGSTPDRSEVCLAVARLHIVLGDRTAAGKQIERAVRLDPTRFPPMQAYLAHLITTGADDAAIAVLNRLARDYRWAGEPFRRAVRGAIRQSSPEASRKLLAAARPFVEGEPSGLGWLGDSYAIANSPSDATACYDRAAQLKIATPDDWLRLAVRTAEAGGNETAIRVMTMAQAKLVSPIYYGMAAAFAESTAAPKNWTPELATPADRRAFTQARLAVRLSRSDRPAAVALLDAFLAVQPPPTDVTWANRNLAMLLAVGQGVNDRARAVRLLTTTDLTGETADEKRSTAAVLTSLARYLDNPERATVLDRAVKALVATTTETKSPRDAYLLAQVYRAAGNKPAIAAVIAQLLAAEPNNVEYQILALDEATDPETALAKKILTDHPGDFRCVAAAARFHCRVNRPESAFLVVDSYVRTEGDPAGKAARAAELYDELVRQPGIRKTDAGRQMLNYAIAKYEGLVPVRHDLLTAAAGMYALDDRPADAFALFDKHPTLPPRVLAAAGVAALRSGTGTDRQFARVRGWLDAALAADPGSIPVRLTEGEFFAARHDYAAAERCYQSVLDADARNVVALNNLAWILAPQPESASRALELVDRAVAEVGLTGELLDTRARVRIAAKQFELAEKDLVEALTRGSTPLRMFHLALAKDGQTPSRKAEARDAFKSAKDRGLDAGAVHPADLPMYRAFDADRQ